MKRVFFLSVLMFNIYMVQAQDITDAVRFSTEDLNGTARFVGMGGAFSALGGDISALKLNPASSSVFLTNYASVSMDETAYKNETDFTDGHNAYRNNNFGFNQAGVVFVFNNANEAATVSRLSFGVAFDRTNSFDNRFTASGHNDKSISAMFLDFAQGVPLNLFTTRPGESLDDLYSYLGSHDLGFNSTRLQTAYLGYETFIFDAVDPSDMDQTAYVSNVTGNSFDQTYRYYGSGSNSKLTFNGGLSIQNKYYLGLNLNSHIIDYRRTTILNELIPNPSEINEIDFVNNLDTKGSGFSFQVGGIAKIGKMFRAGVTYTSPVWYSISDQTTQYLRTDSDQFGEAVANPQIINIYPDYHYRTPGKISGGLAVVFGKSGLISFDYSYKDFSNMKFTSNGFDYANAAIENRLQGASTFRLGGEYRIKNFSIRAGFRYKESPYKDNTIGDMRGYSAGLGYSFGNMRIGFAYDLAQRDYHDPLLNTQFTKRTFRENNLSHYVLTLAFGL